jgi:hypothetical protein
MSARPAASVGEGGVVSDVDALLVHDMRKRSPMMNERRIGGWYAQRGSGLGRLSITRQDGR